MRQTRYDKGNYGTGESDIFNSKYSQALRSNCAQLSEIALSGKIEVSSMLNIFFTNEKSTINHIRVVLKPLMYIFFEVKKCCDAEKQLQKTLQADIE